jgi:hypothetical protein
MEKNSLTKHAVVPLLSLLDYDILHSLYHSRFLLTQQFTLLASVILVLRTNYSITLLKMLTKSFF